MINKKIYFFLRSVFKRGSDKHRPSSVVDETQSDGTIKVALGETLILAGSVHREIISVRQALDALLQGPLNPNKLIQAKVDDDVLRLHQMADLLENLERERLLAISNGKYLPRLQRNYMTFQVGDLGFAIHLDHVREVIGAQGLALGHDNKIRRAIVLDEAIVPVFDLSAIFLGSDSIDLGFPKVVLLSVSGQAAGFLINSEIKVVDLSSATVRQDITSKEHAFSVFCDGELEISSSVFMRLDVAASGFWGALQRK